MKLKDYTKEELELMSYDDIACIILEETKKKMKINDLFKQICDVLGLTEDDFVNQIADFFEILTTDRKFVLLEDGCWDLRTRHSEKIVIEDEEDEYEDVVDTEAEEETEDSDETFFDEESDDDTSEDDLKDLVVIDEDEDI